MRKNDVVQFNESHKWCGCFGFIEEIKPNRIMVGVPMPKNDGSGNGIAYIFCKEGDIEYIGHAVLVTNEDEDEN